MARGFDETDFRQMVKQALVEARGSAHSVVLHEDPREHIDDIVRLLESGDEFGDVFADVGWKDFAKTMGDPGKVKDALVGSALKVGAKARTLLSVLLRGIPSLVIPFIKTHYEQIYTREHSRMATIKQRYPDVFKNASQLFTDDAKMVAFMINPVLMTAAVAAEGSVDAVLGLTSALGVGDNAIIEPVRRIWHNINRLPHHGRPPKGPTNKVEPRGNEDLYYEEGVVVEATVQQRQAAKLLRNNEFQKRLGTSRVVHTIKQEAENAKNETLNALINFATQIRQMEDMDALRKMDSGIAQKVESQIKDLDPGEAESVVQTTLKEIKDASIEALVGKMKADIGMLQQLKIPERSELISAYQKALAEISGESSAN